MAVETAGLEDGVGIDCRKGTLIYTAVSWCITRLHGPRNSSGGHYGVLYGSVDSRQRPLGHGFHRLDPLHTFTFTARQLNFCVINSNGI